MKIFIDTANLDMIKEINSWGILDGVTTNPSLVAKENTDTPTRVKEIAKILGDRPVSAEVMALDADGMIAEGKKLAAIAPNVNVKLPMCIESLKATKALSSEGIAVNMTLIFDPLQALMAAKAGARFVSPFIGRLDDIGTHGVDMLSETVQIIHQYGFDTEIIAASIRHPTHVLDAAEMGCDIATIPYDMELQRKETKEMLDDLTTRDQRMMFGLVTLVHLADSKEQLDSDTETLYSTARRHLCQLSTLRWQQKDGLDTVLPYGLRKIQALRTLTTESTAVLIPFRAQEIMQSNGLYYGQNAVSKNMIVADRRLLLNGNSFRLGVSGSGKSMSAKEEIVQIALSTEDDILILDPESEFGYLTEALGGEVIRISATSDTHINALDMDRAYGDERNPIVSKSEFVLSLFEQLIGDGMVTAKEKSILGRCTEQVYLPYIRNGYKGTPPTLQDFYRLLQMQPEPEAQGLALASELFITGTLNTFAQRTNVDTNARIIDYDIRELGEQLMPLGMLVTLDAIYNRVIRNWKSGKTTWIFCDEFYVLFRYEYSANFFYKLWKRIRKYNGLITGLTQNVEELLRSDTARLMLANSEFLVLLNQSATDREELAKLLNISDTQLGYITNVPAGCGLIRCAGSIVPFTNSFPKNTRLYQLMTTKPDEALR